MLADASAVLVALLKRARFVFKETAVWPWQSDFKRWRITSAPTRMGENALSLVYVGRAELLNDLIQTYFDKPPEVTSDGPWPRRSASKLLAEVSDADLAIREVHPLKPHPPVGAFFHQTLSDSNIDLTPGFDFWFRKVVSISITKNYRRSETLGITTRWSSEIADLKTFYSDLLVPSTRVLHGELASLPEFKVFEELWQPSCLVSALDADGKVLGGLFVIMSKYSPWRFLRLGVAPHVTKDGRLRKIVSARLNIDAVRAACVDGQKSISMGLSPAASTGGIWRYKRSWGATPTDIIPEYPQCAVQARTPRGRAVLEMSGTFVMREDHVTPFVARAADHDLDADRDTDAAVGEALGKEAVTTVTQLGVATILTLTLGLALRLILPRILGPERLGLLYFAESMGLMFFTFLPLGIGTYIMREVPANPGAARTILSQVTPAQGLLGTLIFVLMIGALILTGTDSVTLYCTAVMGIYAAAQVFQRSILRRTYIALGQSALTARLEVFVRILLIMLVGTVLLTGGELLGVALCYAASEVVGATVLLFRARADHYLSEKFSWQRLKTMTVQSLPFFAVGALIEIYGNIDTAMLRFFSGNKEVAFYGAAGRLKAVALVLVPVMQSALQPILSKAWKSDKAAFRHLVTSSMRLLIAFALPITMVLMTVPDLASHLIFGKDFDPAWRSISWLAPAIALTYLNVLLGSCLSIVSNGVSFLAVTAASVVLNIALNVAFIPLGIAAFGQGGGAASAGSATVISELLVLFSMQRIFPVGLNLPRLYSIIVVVALPCVSLALAYSPLMTLSPWLRLAVVVVIAPLYITMTKLLRRSDIDWLLRIKFRRERRMSVSSE